MASLCLVLNTNPLISALLKDSISRKIIKLASLDLLFPLEAFHEIEKHIPLISKRTNLDLGEVREVMDNLFLDIQCIAVGKNYESIDIAKRIMGPIDVKDTPFLALALTMKCRGIWSNDMHLKRQNLVQVFNTKELVHLLDLE